MVNASATLGRPRGRIRLDVIAADFLSARPAPIVLDLASTKPPPVMPSHDHAYDCGGCGCKPAACTAGCGHTCCCVFLLVTNECATCGDTGKIISKPDCEPVDCPACG